MTDDEEQYSKLAADRMREAAELLQTYSAKAAAKKATKAADAASLVAVNNAAIAAEIAALAATAAARLAAEANTAFHRTDDAAAAELPDEALKWSIEATNGQLK